MPRYEICPREAKLQQTQKLLEAPARPVWWERFWGMGAKAAVVLLALVLFAGMVQFTLPLTASPVHAQAKADWADRAEALEKAKDWPGLLAHCLKWTKAEPGNGLAWYNLGDAYGKLGRHQEAVEAFREAVRLKPDFAGAR